MAKFILSQPLQEQSSHFSPTSAGKESLNTALIFASFLLIRGFMPAGGFSYRAKFETQ